VGKDYGSGRKESGGAWVEGKCASNCTGLTDPVLELPHGCVIGGVTYRNDPSSPFYGVYIFADYGRNVLMGLKLNSTKDGVTESKTIAAAPPQKISTMGVDAMGNIYVGTYIESGGVTHIFRLKHADLKPAPTALKPITDRSDRPLTLNDLASSRFHVYGVDGKLQHGKGASLGIARDARTGETHKVVRIP
jgi:hypothetical protein